MGKYWKTQYLVTVLSDEDEPPQFEDLGELNHDITLGHLVGSWNETAEGPVELTGKQMADALYDAACDPEFFGLNEQGDEVEEE